MLYRQRPILMGTGKTCPLQPFILWDLFYLIGFIPILQQPVVLIRHKVFPQQSFSASEVYDYRFYLN